MNEWRTWLQELCAADATGGVSAAADLAAGILSRYVPVERQNGLTMWGVLPGDSDYTILLDAHMDQVAMVVTAIDDEGFLTVAKAGGLDLRALPARPVTVHGKKPVPAVFCSTPPHLAGKEAVYDDLSILKVDAGLGAAAREWISPGDMVTFTAPPVLLAGNRLCARSLDDRAGVVCLLEVARRLSARKKRPATVCFLFSDAEELGMRGVRPAAFTLSPQEAVAVDVTFGNGPGLSPEETGRLGAGPMVGFSPALDKTLSDRLMTLAEQENIPVQPEVMGATTGTNADMIAVSRGGVKTVTLSIPLRGMHTETEIVDLSDIEATCDLLEAYVLSGGADHA